MATNSRSTAVSEARFTRVSISILVDTRIFKTPGYTRGRILFKKRDLLRTRRDISNLLAILSSRQQSNRQKKYNGILPRGTYIPDENTIYKKH